MSFNSLKKKSSISPMLRVFAQHTQGPGWDSAEGIPPTLDCFMPRSSACKFCTKRREKSVHLESKKAFKDPEFLCECLSSQFF